MIFIQYYNGAIVRTDIEAIVQSLIFMILPTEFNVLSGHNGFVCLENIWLISEPLLHL